MSAARLETIYSYGIHNFGGGGLWQLAQTGARWTKSYSDFAGRVFHQERPSFGGGTVATESTYNLTGQLVKVTQPGLVWGGGTGSAFKTSNTPTQTVARAGNSSDLDGDGITDLIFQDNLGQIAVWYLDGHGTTTSVSLLSAAALGDWHVR